MLKLSECAMNFINTKNHNISRIVIAKTLLNFSIKCYSIVTIHPLFFIAIYYYTSRTKQAKGFLSNFIPFYIQKTLMLCKKAVCNGLRLELYTSFDF